VKKESVGIYDSCRIFRNNKSNRISQLDQKNIFIALEDAKKGKIPIVDHSLIASIDIIKGDK
jgi:hypothetical protein